MRSSCNYLIVAVLSVAVLAPALAQSRRSATGSVSSSAATQGTREWSGESGASGSPLMSANAIRAAAANFRTCLNELWPLAARRGVSRASFERFTAGLKPDLRIMDLLDRQPEFTKAFWNYLDNLVTDARIEKGKEILEQHRATFDAVERAFGVDRHVIAAIWGVETNYGTIVGERPVIRSTATLACVGRRQRYFRDEVVATLEILHRGDVHPDRLVGSWAGAFGQTQFMPTAFKRYAVDFDRDGRRDVVDSVADIVASTANKLRKAKWVSGHTWGYEVVVPATLNFALADRRHKLTLYEWQQHGLARPGGKPFPRPDDRAYLLVPAGVQGPGFLMLSNFRSIMRYNPSESYALAVGHLADRLRGGGPFTQDWPRYERALTRDELLELQQLLSRRGYDVGTPDGRLGARTRAAIRQFQARLGRVPDGFASASILKQLRGR